MITIIDYELGNIRAFVNVFDRLSIKTKIAGSKEGLHDAEKIILPGVGAFDHAMYQLNASGMRDTLDRLVIEKKVAILGVCVGMQIMANSSEEGKMEGLGWIEGEVKMFDRSRIKHRTQLPHMGWNTIHQINGCSLLEGLNGLPRFYFLHSYYYVCKNHEHVISKTEYGIEYASAINRENIFGIQFHPEKSHSNGIQILKNFALL